MKLFATVLFVFASLSADARQCKLSDPVSSAELELFRANIFPSESLFPNFYKQLLNLKLSKEEATALQYYKQSGYTELNKNLLDPNRQDDFNFNLHCSANKLLYRGLVKLSSVHGELYRGVREGSPGNIDSVKKGGYWVNRAFMSISKKESIAHGFGKFFIHVRSMTCKDVSWNANINFMAEKEVICLPGTIFKVSPVNEKEIIAQEVSKTPDSLWIRFKKKFQTLMNSFIYF